jgi:hypothetical protein
MLQQLLNDYEATTYMQEMLKVPTSAADPNADMVAMNLSLSTISQDIANTKAAIQKTYQDMENKRQAALQYVQANEQSIVEQMPAMPEVPDGTPATLFGIESGSGCYFVNGGVWSGASVGSRYSILDSNGDCQGYLELAVTYPTYSLGVLVDSDETGIAVGERVDGLYTKTVQPSSSN